jgi:hypothetical protein
MKSSKIPALNLRAVILVGFAAVLMQGCSSGNEQLLKDADAALHKKDYAASEKYLVEALKRGGDAHTKARADVLYKLGDIKRRQRDWVKANEYHNESVAILEELAQGETVDELPALEQLRAIAYKAKDYTRCEELARKILSISDRMLEDGDPRIEAAVSNVLSVACLNGKCTDETELLDRLIALRTKRLGTDAVQTCSARQMAAEAAIHRKDYARAALMYEANVDAYKKLSPKMVPPIMVSWARCLSKAGQPAEALEVLQQVDVPEQSADAVKVLALMGDIYADTGNQAEAGRTYAAMAAAADKGLGPNQQMTADYLVRYAEWLKKNGRGKEAEALDKRIASIYKNGAGKPSAITASQPATDGLLMAPGPDIKRVDASEFGAQ